MIEAVFGTIVSGFLAMIWSELKELRGQVNKIENGLLTHEHHSHSRPKDIDSYTKQL